MKANTYSDMPLKPDLGEADGRLVDSTAEGIPAGTGGRMSTVIGSPRGIGPGLRPQKQRQPSLGRGDADSIWGTAAAAVS